MNQLTQRNHLRYLSMAKLLGATLHKIEGGWKFRLTTARRDDVALEKFQHYFYVPSSPVIRGKRQPVAGFSYTTYSAEWKFQIDPALEDMLLNHFGMAGYPKEVS